MIDFSLTEEQKALQKMAKEFAEKEMRPNTAKYDEMREKHFPMMLCKKHLKLDF